jgi:hypothetical protein
MLRIDDGIACDPMLHSPQPDFFDRSVQFAAAVVVVAESV